MTIAISNDFLLAFANVQKSQQKRVREFIELFREHPDAPSINYERIQKAKEDLYSVRINQGYRAIIYHPAGSDVYVLTWVDQHDEAYAWAENKRFVVNPATGSLQVLSTTAADAAPVLDQTRPASIGLFHAVKDKHLVRLGVPEQLLPLVRAVADDTQLERIERELPQEAYEALFMLASGYTLEQVFDETNKKDEEAPVDTADILAALKNEDSQRRFFVLDSANDREMAEILSAPLEMWRVFLHPKQRRLVSMTANGPVRVLGGAGTGKTVAAMHRAKYLAEQVFPKDRILFTTFTKNLAIDIQENLRKICGVDVLSRIEVIHLDAWVSNFLRTQGYRHQIVFDGEENAAWSNALTLAPADTNLPEAFYRSEWEQVVQAQNINEAAGYLRATRVGRGTKLSREAKAKIWPVFQEYRAQLNEQGKKEFIDLIRDARGLLEAKRITLPYRAIVVDEAQDMSAEAFRLLRAMVPAGPNDLFLVGDAHQRIYRHRVSLGQCGIDIRGRGKKLKINYRTTDEIRRFAVRLLEGRPIDDLDGGTDDQRGYLSLTHGHPPEVKLFPDFATEAKFVKEYVQRLVEEGSALSSICVVARTKKLLDAYASDLQQSFEIYEIRRNSAEQRDRSGLRVATMHRVKGLEFDHMIIVSASAGVIPLNHAVRSAEDEVATRNAETGERSVLYVALTRAKRSALITACGELSAFLN